MILMTAEITASPTRDERPTLNAEGARATIRVELGWSALLPRLVERIMNHLHSSVKSVSCCL
jgi:hypothetical protein